MKHPDRSSSPLFPSLILGLAVFLIVALNLPFARIAIINVDEAICSVAGMEIKEGGIPYRDVAGHRGPLTYLIFGLIFKLFGDWNLAAVHYLFILLKCCTCVWVFLLGKRCFSSWIGALAALIFAVFSWSHNPSDFWAAHTEWPMVCCTSLGMLLLISGEWRPKAIFWGCFCIGIGALSKQVAVMDFLLIPLLLWLRKGKVSSYKELPWKPWCLAGLGAASPLIGFALFMIAQGAWTDLYLYFWKYNTEYYIIGITLGQRLVNYVFLFWQFVEDKWLLIGLVIIGVAKAFTLPNAYRKQLIFVALWLMASLSGALMGGRDFLHYFIQILPPVCLLSAYSFHEVKALFSPLRLWETGTTSLLLVLVLGVPLAKHSFDHFFNAEANPVGFRSKSVYEYVRTSSQPEDKLFVWGFAPEAYVFSQRRPASRFVFTNYQTGLIPWTTLDMDNTDAYIFPGSREALLSDLQHKPPAYIIDTSTDSSYYYSQYPLSSFPGLWDWVKVNYEKDSIFHTNSYQDEQVLSLYKKK